MVSSYTVLEAGVCAADTNRCLKACRKPILVRVSLSWHCIELRVQLRKRYASRLVVLLAAWTHGSRREGAAQRKLRKALYQDVLHISCAAAAAVQRSPPLLSNRMFGRAGCVIDVNAGTKLRARNMLASKLHVMRHI